MATIIGIFAAIVIAGGTAYGVAHSVNDTSQRKLPGDAQISTVVPYGQK